MNISNTYYCEVCQDVYESYAAYENHLHGYKHTYEIQKKNFLDSRYSLLGHVKEQLPTAWGMINLEPPLISEECEIPKWGESYYPALQETKATSQNENDGRRLQTFDSHIKNTTENEYETSNETAERKIDEFLKSILQIDNCRERSQEMKHSNGKDGNCTRSRHKSSESVIRSKKRNVMSKSKNYENISYDESVIDLVSSDESNSAHEFSEMHGHSKTNSTKYKYHAQKKDYKSATNKFKTNFSVHRSPKSSYPQPPPGVNRKETDDVSVIQAVTEDLKYPCIGLDKIIEIQGLDETKYYCEVCDLPCCYRYILAHLEDYQHRLESLKSFVPLIYEDYSRKRKYEAESMVNKTIKVLADMFGSGKIKVQKEYPSNSDSSSRTEKHIETELQHSSNNFKCPPSSTTVDLTTHSNQELDSVDREHIYSHCFSANYSNLKSRQGFSFTSSLEDYHQNMWYQERYFEHDTERMSYAKTVFYCPACNSTMYSKHNWELHLTGGRHIINTKRARGELPFRRRPVIVPDARAGIMDVLDRIMEPVVGLNMVKETQDSDAPGPMYSCSICHANTTSREMVHHILSLKHRIKYLENIGHPYLSTLKERGTDMHSLDEIIRDICATVEAEHGCGYIRVYVRSAEFDYRTYTYSRSGHKGRGQSTIQSYLKHPG